jgi:DNA-binding beta-propeller fold protein YncE
MPTPVMASATRIGVPGGPAALAYVDATDELFVADRAGLIWSLQHGQPTLARPYSVPGETVGLAADPATHRLYVAIRGQPSLVVLDSNTGQQLASTALPVDPGDIRLDPGLGYLSIVLPQRDALQIIDTRDLSTVHVTPDLPRVSGIALDDASHTLYLSQLDGQISAVNGMTGEVTGRWILSGNGLAGVAIANDQLFAANSFDKELVQVDLSTGEATRTLLGVEPGAIVVGQGGVLYVLGIDANAILKFDDTASTEIAREPLGDGTPAVASELGVESTWVRPRMVVSANDERLYVIEPEAGVLAVTLPFS